MATSGTSSVARRTARARAAGVVSSTTAWIAPSSRTTHAYEPRSWIQYTISVVARRLANADQRRAVQRGEDACAVVAGIGNRRMGRRSPKRPGAAGSFGVVGLA